MPILRAAVVAVGVGALVYLMLDSRLVTPEPAPGGLSLSLGALALVFGLGSFVMAKGGQPERSPLLAGLAVGLGGYALLRSLVF